MKKLITIILILAMLLPVASIADLDVKAMSDLELKEAIASCSSELIERAKTPEGWILLFECDGVALYQIGDSTISKNKIIHVPVALINNTDHFSSVHIYRATCNGWEIDALGCRTYANTNKKGELNFFADDSFIDSFEDINSFKFVWEVTGDKDTDILLKQEEPEEHRFW